MNAEMFAAWLDAVRRLTRDQRGQTFMMLALGEAEEASDWTQTEASGMADEPAAVAALQCGDWEVKMSHGLRYWRPKARRMR
jgi:hypothetical protein